MTADGVAAHAAPLKASPPAKTIFLNSVIDPILKLLLCFDRYISLRTAAVLAANGHYTYMERKSKLKFIWQSDVADCGMLAWRWNGHLAKNRGEQWRNLAFRYDAGCAIPPACPVVRHWRPPGDAAGEYAVWSFLPSDTARGGT
jgi:hypothetical protein